MTWPVLDTCSIPISSLSLIKHPTGAVARHIAKVGEDAICTSIVVACKLRYGAVKKGSPVLSDKIGQLLSTIEVLPLEEGADEKYAEVRTALERAGTLIGAKLYYVLVITHDLPFALELCERAVVVDRGRVVADAATVDILSDEPLLDRHRLALPFGFDPSVVRRQSC